MGCKTRVEQLEIEFYIALDALSMIQDSDDESEENARDSPLFQNRTHQYESLKSRYILAREKYKTELWNRDFEPVLQRIRAAANVITNADLEESAKSEAVRRLMACGCVVQKEKVILSELLGDCMRMGTVLGDVGLFLGTLSGPGERRGSWSCDLDENTDETPIQNLEHDNKTVAADSFDAKLPETSLTLDSKIEAGDIDFRAHCDRILTSLQNMHVNSNEDRPSTLPENTCATPTVSAPLITYLYAAVTEHIAAAQLQAENASLRAAMLRERKELDVMFAEVQCRNEEELSLVAGLLIEAVQVQSEAERVRATARADLGVSIKIREELARRRCLD